MRTDDYLLWLAYFAIVGAVIGVWLRHRRKARRREARLAMIPQPRHRGEPGPRVARSTVYCSREAMKDQIIREYDATRTTVMRLRPDPAELERVWSLARRVGQNDRAFDSEAARQDHEPFMSRDLDIPCYPMLRDVTKLRPDTGV